MRRTIAMLVLAVSVCAPMGAQAGEETRTYPFVLFTDVLPSPSPWQHVFIGTWHCQPPDWDEELPVAAQYCPEIPLDAVTVDIRVENVPTGTDLDPLVMPVAVEYGTNYSPGPHGSFCGRTSFALNRITDVNPRLILRPRGPVRGPAICGGLAPRPGIAIAGQIVVTFRW